MSAWGGVLLWRTHASSFVGPTSVQPALATHTEQLVHPNRHPNYQKSLGGVRRVERVAEQLQVLMNEERIYLNRGLQRRDVSEPLGMSVHLLSQVFSQVLDTTFYAYLNQHRMQAAIRMLQDSVYAHLTLYAMALEVGFSSKATINRTFK